MNRIYVYILIFTAATLFINLLLFFALENYYVPVSDKITGTVRTTKNRQKISWTSEELFEPAGIYRIFNFFGSINRKEQVLFKETVNFILDNSRNIENGGSSQKSVISTTTTGMPYLDNSEPVNETYRFMINNIDRLSQTAAHASTEWMKILRMPTTGYHSFNHTVSDSIGNFRHALPEYRHQKCQKFTYDLEALPKTSIIIIFHNEARSTLLRTLHAIYDRTPKILLHEIILVDDASTLPWLLKPLDNYLAHLPRIRLYRLAMRQGLIRARTKGAEEATGEVLFFLDAHTEVTEGWLEPLLSRIKENRKALVFPEMDPIQHKTFEFWRAGDQYYGGFFWDMEFKYKIMRKEMRETRADPTSPIPSPVMVGCAHAIDRRYFFESGAYDTDMEIWGGENIEHAFRLWMCGGRVEVIPCSRVGHVFKPLLPYSFTGDSSAIIQRNLIRIAEVWMDEYKKYFYGTQLFDISPIDLKSLQKRKELRKRMKCKSFDWYLKNIYPEMPIPPDNAYYFGHIKSVRNEGRCIAVNSHYYLESTRCEMQEWYEHHFDIQRDGQFRYKNSCVSVDASNFQMKISATNSSVFCSDKWKFKRNEKQIQVLVDGEYRCITLHLNSKLLTAEKCEKNNDKQLWNMRYEFDIRQIDIEGITNEIMTPPSGAIFFGTIENVETKLCLNVYENREYAMKPCDVMRSYEKVLHYDSDERIRFRQYCITASPNEDIMVIKCEFAQNKPQLWKYEEQKGDIRLIGQGKCMTYNPQVSNKVQLLPCAKDNKFQKWKMDKRQRELIQ